jgi:hypothetical protein
MTESELESLYFRLGRLERRVLELENEQGVAERAGRVDERSIRPEDLDTSPKWFVLCRDDNRGLTFATRRWFATSQLATVYAATVAPTRGAFVVYSLGLPGYEEHSFGK